MKKFLIAILILFSVSACGAVTEPMTFENDIFTISFESNWYLVDDFSELSKYGIEDSSDLMFALFSKEDSLVVPFILSHEYLEKEMTLEEFKGKNTKIIESIDSYELKELDEMSISDLDAILHQFYLGENELERVEYIQSFLYSGKDSYIMTSSKAGEISADKLNEIKSIMRSFTLKH